MSTGKYAARIFFDKAVRKRDGNGQYKNADGQEIMVPAGGEFYIDVQPGFTAVLAPRETTIGGIKGPRPIMSLRIVKDMAP